MYNLVGNFELPGSSKKWLECEGKGHENNPKMGFKGTDCDRYFDFFFFLTLGSLYYRMVTIIKCERQDWREASAVKNTGHSSVRPGFYSKHLHGGSQLFITQVLGDLVSSLAFVDPSMYMVQKRAGRQTTYNTQKMIENTSYG